MVYNFYISCTIISTLFLINERWNSLIVWGNKSRAHSFDHYVSLEKKTVTRDFTDKSEGQRFRASEFAVSSARRMTLPPILRVDDVLAQIDSAPVHVDKR